MRIFYAYLHNHSHIYIVYAICFLFLQGLNFLRMSARVDGVASRVQSAIQMRQVHTPVHVHIVHVHVF